MRWHYRPDDDTLADEDLGYFSVAHYMLYQKVPPEIRLQIGEHRTSAYAASNYLRRVKPGDVLWLITVHDYELYLLGRLKVEFVVDDTEIAQSLVDPQPEEWHEADWYAISNKYAVEPMRELRITHLAESLRFQSRASEMLDVVGGRVEANQLTTLRQLMPQSAQLLDDVWYSDVLTPQSMQDFLEIAEDDAAYTEGKQVVRTIKQRQRSRKLVNDAKARFRALHDGRLFCEVCGFDFDAAYGVDYIEAHHTEPLSEVDGETSNTTQAVVMLCANCHRAAHTRTPPFTVDELKQMRNGTQDKQNGNNETDDDKNQ